MIEAIVKNSKIDLTDLGIIQVSGKNSKQFLQGQLTCDVQEVNTHQTRLGAHCDARGRVQATFRLFFYQNDYYFLLPRSMAQHLISSLQKYAIFSKVVLNDVSKDWQKIGLYGPSLAELVDAHALFNTPVNSLAQSGNSLSLSIPGPSSRFILLAPIAESIAFIDANFVQQTLNQWNLLDIMIGIPTIYPETTGQFTPHQLNYPAIGGVSFNKGCYIGQEIIARTRYLGKSKSRLYRVSFQTNSPTVPGTPLLQSNAQPVGNIIICANEANHQYQALASLQNQAISHTIYLGSHQGPILKLLALPYSL